MWLLPGQSTLLEQNNSLFATQLTLLAKRKPVLQSVGEVASFYYMHRHGLELALVDELGIPIQPDHPCS